jgi:integrase
VRLHDVRHFVATTLLTSGVDLATVAGRLGHGGGGKTTLAIYSHFLREPDRVASDLMASVLKRQEEAPQSPLETNVLPMNKRTSKSG